MPPPTPPNADTGDIDYQGEAAKKLARRCIDDVGEDRAVLDRHKQDWLNLLMDRGGEDNQWVTWDQTSDAWVRIPTDGDFGLPSEVPRACTNLFANKIGGIAAILNQSEPAQEWRPSTDDDQDLATAEVAGDILPALLDEVSYDTLKPVINKGVSLTDKVALLVYYDGDPRHGTSMVQAYRCTSCESISMPMDIDDADDTCPKCGADARSDDPMGGDEPIENFEPAVDSMFNPIGAEYPTGKLCAELLTTFDFSLPRNSASPNPHDNAFVVVHKRYSEAEFLSSWGEEHKELLKKASASGDKVMAQQYADALRSLTSPHVATQGKGGQVLGPLVHRVIHDPIDTDEFKFPDGLFITLCGDTILESGPLPVHDDNGKGLKNIVIRTYARQFGTAAGKPPADDMVPLQRMRNLWETIGALIGLRYAMPTTFIPTTVTLETPITGLPQPEVWYRSHDGQRPQTESGRADGRFVFEMLDRIDQKLEEISGLNAILQGERPEGDPTLGEVQRLEDRAYGQFKTALDELIRFEKDLSMLLLRFARETFWAPRMLKIRGENGAWEVSQFTNADLSGNVDVYVNPISAWPKSQLMQHLRVKEALALGVLPPPIQDPELQVKLLSDWNLSHLKHSLDVDRKQIARELDRWKQAQTPQEILPPGPMPTINPVMHLHYKTQFLKTEEAERLQKENAPVWQAMLMHVQQLQMMTAPPAPPAEPGEKKPDGSALDAAVHSGALKPASDKPQSPINDLVKSGVLVPAPGGDQASAAH